MPFEVTVKSCMDHGDSSNSLWFRFCNHIGTHVDLPSHFDPRGARLTDYALEDWFFKNVQWLEVPLGPGGVLSPTHLRDRISAETQVLLIRTGFERLRKEEVYWKDNPGIAEETGTWLREEFPSLQIIGFDFISVSGFQNRELGRRAHRTLLSSEYPGKPLRVIEDMRLSELKTPIRNLLISPLLVGEADGIQVSVWANVGT